MIERWQSPGGTLWGARAVGFAALCLEDTFGTGATSQSPAFFIAHPVSKASEFISKYDDRSGAYSRDETKFEQGCILKVLCVVKSSEQGFFNLQVQKSRL